MDVPLPVKEDSPLDPAAVRKRLQTVLERAEYNRLHFHGLRHTFATTALQNGVHVRTVSSMPGHYDTGFALRTYPHTAKQKHVYIRDSSSVSVMPRVVRSSQNWALFFLSPNFGDVMIDFISPFLRI